MLCLSNSIFCDVVGTNEADQIHELEELVRGRRRRGGGLTPDQRQNLPRVDIFMVHALEKPQKRLFLLSMDFL